MKSIEYILDFAIEIAKEMLENGANIERVNLTMAKICKTYDLEDVSIYSLNTYISLSAKDKDANYCSRQVNVNPVNINLERFKALNLLSHKVYDTKPNPEDLFVMLHTIKEPTYPWYIILIGFIIAMASLGRIFGGGLEELLVIELNTLIMFGLNLIFKKISLNHIIANFINMFISTTIGLFFANIGFVENFYIVIITNAFYLIPGIPMVNSARNIICGNEMNGIIELLKVVLEVIILVAGIASSYFFFSGSYDLRLEDAIYSNSGLVYNLELIMLTLLATLGFSIVFNIHKLDLLLATLGGGIIRVIYIFLQMATDYRIVYTILAAFSSALYAEILCSIKKKPSTLYLYPAIIPLIPGDLIYYTMLGIVWPTSNLFEEYSTQTLLALIGMAVGFVLASSFMHYIRRFKIKKFFKIKKVEKINNIKTV